MSLSPCPVFVAADGEALVPLARCPCLLLRLPLSCPMLPSKSPPPMTGRACLRQFVSYADSAPIRKVF